MPQQTQRDWDVTIATAVGRLDKFSGAELQVGTRSVTTDLMRRLPTADRVYLEQMMFATYCSTLRDNAELTEGERNTRIQAYGRELRATLATGQALAAGPRSAARAELASLPVEYTPEAFLNAAKTGKSKVVQLFLRAGMDPGAVDKVGVTALMHAAARGDLQMIDALLKAGASVNARTLRDHTTALAVAASVGRLEAMRRLMAAGADKGTFDDALFEAFQNAEIEAARLLRSAGAKLPLADGRVTSTLGWIAVDDKARASAMLAFAIGEGWTVDATHPDNPGLTALMKAASNERILAMSLLIEAGADANRVCTCPATFGGRQTALTLAAAGVSTDAVKILLDAGANPDHPEAGASALGMVAKTAGDKATRVAALLLARGADAKRARDEKGVPAIVHAAGHGDVELVSMLLVAGSPVDDSDRDGFTALSEAASIRFFLSGEVPPEGLSLLKLLKDHGADLEHRDKRGRTALISAVRSGNFGAVRWLLEHGARRDAVDDENRSLLDHARTTLHGEEQERMLGILQRKVSQ